MNKESIFFKEWLAIDRHPAQLPISSVCNYRCIFCSNYQNPFPIAKNIFRELEDIKTQLCLMPAQYAGPIRMSDALPGRISEGEAFLHPKFFEILELVRRRFLTNVLEFTTNGSMLDEPFLERLARFRPIEIMVSLHSTRPELWARIFGRGASLAGRAIRSPALIRKYGLALAGAIVTLPEICGWPDIERSYASFVAQGAKLMMIWWPGYTQWTLPQKLKDLECSLKKFEAFAAKMKNTYKVPLIVCPETKAPLNLPVKRIMASTMKGNIKTGGGPYRQVLWLASEAVLERLADMIKTQAPSFSNCHRVAPVKNVTYGGNIICAGLLLVKDFILAGRQALQKWPECDLILVPETPFDTLLMDLEGTPAFRMAEDLNKPVWIVADNGSFNSLLGRGFLKAEDTLLDRLTRTMKIFNSAWADEGQAEKSRDLIAAFPIATSRGMISRQGFVKFLRKEKSALSPGGRPPVALGASQVSRWPQREARGKRAAHGAVPLNQRFELLDESHALCIEQWPAPDRDAPLNKWTFFVRKGDQWKIERLLRGKAGDLAPR